MPREIARDIGRAIDQDFRIRRSKQLKRCLMPKAEPSLKMLYFEFADGHMQDRRGAPRMKRVIARPKQNPRPEIDHAAQVIGPIVNAIVKDITDVGIVLYFSVKCVHDLSDGVMREAVVQG